MNRTLALVVLVTLLILTGCAQKASPPPATSGSPKASATSQAQTTSAGTAKTTTSVKYPLPGWPRAVTVPYIGTGGDSQAKVTMFSSLVEKYLKVTATPVQVRGSAEALVMAYKGEADVNFTASPYDFPDVMQGKGDWAQYGKLNHRILMRVEGYATFNAVTWDGSGIKTGQDLRGKRIMYRSPGSPASTLLSEIFLGTYNLKPSDVTPLSYASYQEIWDALRDKTIDAALFIRNPPNAELVELAKNTKLKWLGLSLEAEAKVNNAYAWIATSNKGNLIPANTYKGQDTDISTLGYASIRHVRTDFPDSFVYQLLNIIYGDYHEEYVQAHATAKLANYKLEPFHIGVAPYHPGAIQFYKDKGVWTKEHDEKNNKALEELDLKK